MKTTALFFVSGLLCALVGCATNPSASPTASPFIQTDNTPLQPIIDDAPTNGPQTITLPAGRHVLHKGLVIDGRDSLTLIVPSGTEILVDDVNAHVLTISNSTNISIQGGLWQHLKPLTTYQCHGSVLWITHSSDIVVQHATLRGCGAVGVNAHNVNRLTVKSCAVLNNTFNGFYLDRCVEVRIWDNIIENNANTLQAERLFDLEMSGNLIRNNGGYWRTPATRPGP